MPFEAAPSCDVDPCCLPVVLPGSCADQHQGSLTLADDLYTAMMTHDQFMGSTDFSGFGPYSQNSLPPLSQQNSLSPFPCLADELEQQGLDDSWNLLPPLPRVNTIVGGNGQLGMTIDGTSSAQNGNVLIRKGEHDFEDGTLTPMVPVQSKPSAWVESHTDSGPMLPQTPVSGHCDIESRREYDEEDPTWAMMQMNFADNQEKGEKTKGKSAMRHVPLAVALLNLQCLHMGAESYYKGAWIGCPHGAWCSLPKEHLGECDTMAVVPGPGAYLPEELAAVGLTATGPWLGVDLPKAAVELAGTVKGVRLEDMLQFDVTPASPIQQSHGARRMHLQQQISQPVRQSTRRRAKKRLGDDIIYSEKEYHHDSEHESSMTDEAQLDSVSHSDAEKSSSKKAAVGTRTSRRASARKNIIASVVQKSKRGGRNTNRKAPQVWVSGQVMDPRTGVMVTEVPPATFCTQCNAVNTPVWRAGPFGHKTLCNACGVRWMKVVPKKK